MRRAHCRSKRSRAITLPHAFSGLDSTPLAHITEGLQRLGLTLTDLGL